MTTAGGMRTVQTTTQAAGEGEVGEVGTPKQAAGEVKEEVGTPKQQVKEK